MKKIKPVINLGIRQNHAAIGILRTVGDNPILTTKQFIVQISANRFQVVSFNDVMPNRVTDDIFDSIEDAVGYFSFKKPLIPDEKFEAYIFDNSAELLKWLKK